MNNLTDSLANAWGKMSALQIREVLVLVIISMLISMLLFLMLSKRNNYKVIDLGMHKWLIK